MGKGPEQWVVIYEGPGGRIIVYETAYTEEQRADALRRCGEAYPGSTCRVRRGEDVWRGRVK